MRTLVHAGFHKTGTTTLQAFLSRSTAWLAANGIDYPAAGRGESPAHHALACACAGERDAAGPNDLFLPERHSYCRRCRDAWAPPASDDGGAGIGTRLYSSEIFSTFDPAELRRLHEALGGIDRFILYRRGGIGYLYSCWATKVRWGATLSFRTFLGGCIDGLPGTPIAGGQAFLEALHGMVGPAGIDVRSYEAACRHAGGIVGDFVEHVLGLPADAAPPVAPPMNRTPAPELVELTRALQLARDGGAGTGRAYPALTAALRRDPGAGRLVDALCALVGASMRPLSIAGLGRPPGLLDAEGRVRAGAWPAAGASSDWRFAPGETRAQADTPALLDAVSARTEFAELMALLRMPA